MCAIAGMIGLTADEAAVKAMITTMKRRGPDGFGVYADNMATLLHTRLAIIDPEGGAQPMTIEWAGESYTIVYNGELYNTNSVRKRLLSLGHVFTGHSDTEVVVHAYAQWKESCLEVMNGIYAFGIWEKGKQRLFLARDRIGVKPLFWKEHDRGLIFASEIKTILKYPGVRAELDAQGAAEIVMLGPGRTPGSGVFRGIRELKPGWCGYYQDGRLRQRRYWQLKDREHTDSFETTVDTVRSLVVDAIESQMVSDVPIGTFLSGGLDSSLISAICGRKMEAQGKRLYTFSVDYENNDRYFVPGKFQPNADTSFIKIMESELNSDHAWTVLTPEDLVNTLEQATVARDLPGMADVDFSLHRFCLDIRGRVKVALSGECADEIFGGYPWYRDPEVRSLVGFPWAQNTRLRQSFLNPEIANQINLTDYVMDRYMQTVHDSDILPGVSPMERRMKEMVNLNQQWFMQTLLDRKDRMSMYHGLEVRVPFCDHRIAEYLYGVPWEMKDHLGVEKGLLRKAMEGILPKEVLWRKKSPYPKTHDPRYLELIRGKLRELLNTPGEPIYQIIRKDTLTALMEGEYVWPWYGQLMSLPQTMAYMLQINYWMKAYQISVV